MISLGLVYCDINALNELSILYTKFLETEEFGTLGSSGCCNIYNTNNEISLGLDPCLNTQLIFILFILLVFKNSSRLVVVAWGQVWNFLIASYWCSKSVSQKILD